jgi:hypothetical protein
VSPAPCDGGSGLAEGAARRRSFEQWEPPEHRFNSIVAASSWHWIDPSVGWRRAHNILTTGGWLALPGHVVIRRPDQPEVYAATADLHAAPISATTQHAATWPSWVSASAETAAGAPR